jgi:hypothetical protein
MTVASNTTATALAYPFSDAADNTGVTFGVLKRLRDDMAAHHCRAAGRLEEMRPKLLAHIRPEQPEKGPPDRASRTQPGCCDPRNHQKSPHL